MVTPWQSWSHCLSPAVDQGCTAPGLGVTFCGPGGGWFSPKVPAVLAAHSPAQFLISNAVASQSPPLTSILSVLIWGKWRNLPPPSYPLLNPHLKPDSDTYKPFPNGIKGFLFSCSVLLLPAILSFNPCSKWISPGKYVGKSISLCSTWHRGTGPLNSFPSVWVGSAYLQNEPAMEERPGPQQGRNG